MKRHKSVLIVDDEPDIRDLLVREFQKRGWETHEAGTGNQGYDLGTRINVSLVISDVRMPDGTGRELLEKFRADDSIWPIVILLTGFMDVSQVEAKNMGAQGYFSKPFDFEIMANFAEDLFKELNALL